MLRRVYLTMIVSACFATIFLIGCASSSIEGSAPVAQSTGDPTAVPLPTATSRPIQMPESTEAPEMMEPIVETTFGQWVKDDSPAEGAESTLIRMQHGVYANLKAEGLEPNDVYTMWWMIMNKPENCTDAVCGLDDGFIMDENGDVLMIDSEPQMNWPGRAAADFSVQHAAGSIVDADGSIEFRAHLPLGDANDTLFGGEGLDDAFHAEIHVMIRSHGQAIPGEIHSQMFTPWGGCPEGWPKAPCKNVIFAIHRPVQ